MKAQLLLAMLFVSAAFSLYAFYDVSLLGHSHVVQLFQWIGSGDLLVNWTVRVGGVISAPGKCPRLPAAPGAGQESMNGDVPE
jgi:hypothetical protein